MFAVSVSPTNLHRLYSSCPSRWELCAPCLATIACPLHGLSGKHFQGRKTRLWQLYLWTVIVIRSEMIHTIGLYFSISLIFSHCVRVLMSIDTSLPLSLPPSLPFSPDRSLPPWRSWTQLLNSPLYSNKRERSCLMRMCWRSFQSTKSEWTLNAVCRPVTEVNCSLNWASLCKCTRFYAGGSEVQAFREEWSSYMATLASSSNFGQLTGKVVTSSFYMIPWSELCMSFAIPELPLLPVSSILVYCKFMCLYTRF